MKFRRESGRGPTYYLGFHRFVVIDNLLMPTSVWGQADPLQPVVFYKNGQPVALLAPMDL